MLSIESLERKKSQARLEYERALDQEAAKRKDWLLRRARFRLLVDTSLERQAAVWKLCASTKPFTFYHKDIVEKPIVYPNGLIFFFDWYLNTYDPRTRERWVPFLLYMFQIEILLWLLSNVEACIGNIERRNLLIEKARDMGISWLVCGFILWYVLFRNGDFLIGSRKLEEVDKKGDLDCPFQRIREMMSFLPSYLHPPGFDPRIHDKECLFINPKGGQIAGEASTPNFGRGGRYLMVWLDEQQAWEYAAAAYNSCAQTTNVRLSVGTADGMDNLFYELRSQKDVVVDVKTLVWRLHPIKGAGAYLDSNNKWTSPWYEEQVKTMRPEDVAAEIDIVYDRSARGIVFNTYVPEMHGQDHVAAMPKGEIIRAYDPGQKHFFVLWVQFDEFGRVLVLRELHLQDARLRDVGQAVLDISRDLERKYPYYEFRYDDIGDPQGGTRTGAGVDHPDYVTLQEEFDLFISYDFLLEIPYREKARITAIKNCLNDFVSGAPGSAGAPRAGTMKLLVDKTHCPITHRALMSGFRFKTDKLGRALPGELIAENRPDNDAIDCLGYAILRKWGVIDTKERDIELHDGFTWEGHLNRRIA